MPGKHISRRTAWWWLAGTAPLAAGVTFVWLCARPGGCHIGSHLVKATTETLRPSDSNYNEPSGFKSSFWDGPTGSFSSGNNYGLKFGHWMLRLDITRDPIETTRRRLSKTVPSLIAVLDSDNRFRRMVAVEELGKLGAAATPALPGLIGMMDKNDYSPVDAVSKIAAQAGGSALPALTNGLKSSSAFVRARIGEILPTLGEAARPSAPALRQCLTDEAPSVRIPAALALWQITGDTNGPVSVLAALLSDRDPQIAARAAAALGEMGFQAQAAVPALRTALQSKDSLVRAMAAQTLGKMGPAAAPAMPELIIRLGKLQPLEQKQSLELQFTIAALGQLGSSASAAIPRLALLAQGESGPIAVASLAALGGMGRDAVPALLEMFQTNSPARLSYAAKALGSIGPSALSAAPRLRQCLGADVHTGLRASAALALWKMGERDDAIIHTLTDCLSDDTGRVRAVRALADIGPPAKAAIPALEAAKSNRITGVNREIETALARITGPPLERSAK